MSVRDFSSTEIFQIVLQLRLLGGVVREATALDRLGNLELSGKAAGD